MCFFFFFQAEDGIRDAQESRGLGDVYKRQGINAEYGVSVLYCERKQHPQHTHHKMCYAVKCENCNKTTWAGCGQHIPSVKATVPANQWCECSASDRKPAGGACIVS
eukprot:TRINITY_DN28942_c0_g1_i1.p1 TRINITY_DN28942_c0_g1~~TRINITY_DN28942_c0_g1_i1.p1  ORF type:complete len:107 (+),score=29.67 TRINITY_DN28942_c0_g1_i1:63-383(+)